MGEAFIVRRGGSAPVPSLFGDGRDGDLYIAAGQTVVLPVAVPHQSVVEKQYKSITIEAGGVLRCSAPNAGLVLRCKGNCTIHGTIDQSLMAPKTNPYNHYTYPSEVKCGSGGQGGNEEINYPMAARTYGGGYGSGGSGGEGGPAVGGTTNGAASNDITVAIDTIFVGAILNSRKASYGGGGSGRYGEGAGGNGAGGAGSNDMNANSSACGGGGAGNVGGGVLLLYINNECFIDGRLLCHGGNGGSGGNAYVMPKYTYGGSGGGGGGGGAIYVLYNNIVPTIAGELNISGGWGGNGGTGGYNGAAGASGGIGTITIKKYVRGMTV